MEVALEKLVLVESAVEINPDVEENDGSDNEETVIENTDATAAVKKRKKKRNKKPKGIYMYR